MAHTRYGLKVLAVVLTGSAPVATAGCSNPSNPAALGTSQGTQNDGGVVDATTQDSGTARDTGSSPEDSMVTVDSGEGAECGAGLTQCNGVACVDLATSPNNCGVCNHVCTGVGVIFGCCDAGCVDNSHDPKNCGSCGFECEAGMFCDSGMCL